MKKVKLIVPLLVVLVICMLTSCKENKTEVETKKTSGVVDPGTWKFSRNIARQVNEDGWVYTFEYEYMKDEYKHLDDEEHFLFNGVNLRYRYHEDYLQESYTIVDGEEVVEYVPAIMLWLCDSNSEAIKRDMKQVSQILGQKGWTVSKEELLNINPDDYTFEELDKDLFFGLMFEALNGEPHEEGHNLLPSYALLNEQTYIDGYEFQIGFLPAMGTIDVIFIDVLYKTGEEYNDYIQLSDMVDDGTATEDEVKLYSILKDIEKSIIEDNNFMAGKEEYEGVNLEGVSLKRLYTMLENIDNDNFSMYSVLH